MDYRIFLPNGEVVESDKGVPEIYRVEGTIVHGRKWNRWASGTWHGMLPDQVPAHIRAYILIAGETR